MRDILDFLDVCALHAEAEYAMWDCVEREEFEDAMVYQFKALHFRDEALHMLDGFDAETAEFLATIKGITYGC